MPNIKKFYFQFYFVETFFPLVEKNDRAGLVDFINGVWLDSIQAEKRVRVAPFHYAHIIFIIDFFLVGVKLLPYFNIADRFRRKLLAERRMDF